MTIKQMWKYLIFQTRGYKIINVVMVLGVFSETSAVYINSFFYAKMVDSLIKKNYEKGIYLSLIMVIAVLILHIVERGCKQIFEHYIRPCRDETKERTVNKAFSMDYEEFEKKKHC